MFKECQGGLCSKSKEYKEMEWSEVKCSEGNRVTTIYLFEESCCQPF